ncbi:DUF6873 family GME fold protein [Filifactor villosus]
MAMSYLCEKNHSDFLVNPVLKNHSEVIDFMKIRGINPIFLSEDHRLYKAIQGHPDIIGCPVFSKTIIEKEVYRRHKKELENFEIAEGSTLLSETYPHNVAYNTAVFGKAAIYGRWIDPVLLRELEQTKVQSFVVNQGYAKCNIVIIDQRSIITSDQGIYRTCRNVLNILLVSPWKEIELPGLDYGFLGGTCFTRGDEVCFTGDITKHPDYRKIKDFVEKRNKKLFSMKGGTLVDVGSFLPLYKKNRD